MQKFYFYKEEDIEFLKSKGWKLNEEKGYWECEHIRLYPDKYNMHYVLKFPGYNSIVYQSQIDTIVELQKHTFSGCYEENDFLIQGEWYNSKAVSKDSNGYTIIGDWPHKTLKFNAELAYNFILQKTERIIDVLPQNEEETEDDFYTRVDNIETVDDLNEYVSEKAAVDYCEKLFNKKNKAFIEYIKPMIAPAYMVWIGCQRVNISQI